MTDFRDILSNAFAVAQQNSQTNMSSPAMQTRFSFRQPLSFTVSPTSSEAFLTNHDNNHQFRILRLSSNEISEFPSCRSAYMVSYMRHRSDVDRSLTQFFRAAVFGYTYNLPVKHNLGAMNVICSINHCKALHYASERGIQLHSCCHNGKVKIKDYSLSITNVYPDQLKQLLTGTDDLATHFREHIRVYNSANALASFKATSVEFATRGPSVYCIQGQIYYGAVTSIQPPTTQIENRLQRYGQLFILDPSEALDCRLNNEYNRACKHQIMEIIDAILRRINPYVSAYRRLGDVYKQALLANQMVSREIKLFFVTHQTDDRRVYNPPTVDEISIIYTPGRDGEPPSRFDIAVFPNNSSMTEINKKSPHIDPMVFVLFFPFGEQGWRIGLEHEPEYRTARNSRLTPRQWYSSKIATRLDTTNAHFSHNFNPLHYGCRLYQQYLCHAWVLSESNALDWIRFNQQNLRVESYQGLHDYVFNYVDNQGESSDMRIGNIVILPSSFPGSKRNMQQQYQDAMAIVRKYGKADLFITFTCNPNWQEIKDQLHPGQKLSDRPDIVAKVFYLKLQHFMSLITKRYIFGIVTAFVWTLEFQKRGLPHCHALFTLNDTDKFVDGNALDNVIMARIPTLDENPELRYLVIRHMIHRPCGVNNPTAPCMVDGKCSKGFPKSFTHSTEANNNGYPSYYRPDNTAEEIMIGNLLIHNGWVVPYNPYLLLTYEAHINVEYCASVKSYKYIYKYIHKGPDRAHIQATTFERHGHTVVNFDEITEYLDTRYLSAPEACWRLTENICHDKSHTVMRLAVHLPEGQPVYFNDGNEVHAINRALLRKSTLMAWFDLNTQDSNARTILYHNIPEKYRWVNNTWRRYARTVHTIGRLRSVSPRDTECFHLRLILVSNPGFTSFEDILTVNDYRCATFKESAMRRGLIVNNDEYEHCLMEASSWSMPLQLRHLFANLLLFCDVPSPISLWNKFKDNFLDDFINKDHLSYSHAISRCLLFLDSCFAPHGKSCSFFNIIDTAFDSSYRLATVCPNNIIANHSQIGQQMYSKLNSDQLLCAQEILNAPNTSAKFFFIDGPGGSGKTFLYTTLYHLFRASRMHVVCMAWTGIAAILLPAGRTCHTTFRLPLNINSSSTCNLKKTDKEILSHADVIIWDEISMVPQEALNLIDLTLRDLMRTPNVPFGNKIIILGGDFRQILPVVPKASRSQIVSACVKSWPKWSLFKHFALIKNMRSEDPDFARWLLTVGNDMVPKLPNTLNKILIPQSFISRDLITDIFGLSITMDRVSDLLNTAILCPTNVIVNKVNEDILNRLDGDIHCYRSIDTVEASEFEDQLQITVNYPVEFLNTINPSGLPPHMLNLKKGAIVILLRNIAVDNGLCNGTRLIIRNMLPNVLDAEIVTGPHKGSNYFIPRITLNTENDPLLPFNLCRRQFPVRLAFAMTINKSQGQTLDRVGLLLNEPVFSHGQLYVALSRVRLSDGLRVDIRHNTLADDISTSNIVYREVLRN